MFPGIARSGVTAPSYLWAAPAQVTALQCPTKCSAGYSPEGHSWTCLHTHTDTHRLRLTCRHRNTHTERHICTDTHTHTHDVLGRLQSRGLQSRTCLDTRIETQAHTGSSLWGCAHTQTRTQTHTHTDTHTLNVLGGFHCLEAARSASAHAPLEAPPTPGCRSTPPHSAWRPPL